MVPDFLTPAFIGTFVAALSAVLVAFIGLHRARQEGMDNRAILEQHDIALGNIEESSTQRINALRERHEVEMAEMRIRVQSAEIHGERCEQNHTELLKIASRQEERFAAINDRMMPILDTLVREARAHTDALFALTRRDPNMRTRYDDAVMLSTANPAADPNAALCGDDGDA